MKTEYLMFAVMALFLVAGVFYVGTKLGGASEYNIYPDSQPPDHAISTNGEAKMNVAPDTFTVTFGVTTTEENASLSKSRNAEIMQRVKEELLAFGISEEKIKTSYYNVREVERSYWVCDEYADSDYYNDCRRGHYEYETIGFETVHEFTVETSDLEKGGGIIDTAVDAGATNIRSVRFSLSEEGRDQYEAQLLEQAAQDAKNKAQAIASGLGVSLGKPTQVSQSVSYPRYYYDYSYAEYVQALSMEGEGSATTPISEGELEISVTLSASFAIE